MKKNIMNLLVYILILFLSIIVIIQVKKPYLLPINFGYVYSESMEPTIYTYDGYVIIKSKEYKVGDIITFIPMVFKDNYITHRIIAVNDDNTFITKGDNNESADQEIGEPNIKAESIRGKVLEFNNKPIIIPRLGIILIRIRAFIDKLNLFSIAAIIIAAYLFRYIIVNFIKRKHNRHKKKKRLLDIAHYLDPLFITSISLFFINCFLIAFTVYSWKPLELSYVVVATEGLSSPTPGESFTKTSNLENNIFLPYVIYFEASNPKVTIDPRTFDIPPYRSREVTITITAPDEIGLHTEKIPIRTYPNVLPEKLTTYLYNINDYLPLVIIFLPIAILNIMLLICWYLKWMKGRRIVMDWLIPLRGMYKRIIS